MFSYRLFFLILPIVLTSYSSPAAARHPHDDEQLDAILRLLHQTDDQLAAARDVLRKSPELSATGSPVAPVHQSIERTLAEMGKLRTAIHLVFDEPEVHESPALGPMQKVAREMARMSAALRAMSAETVQVARRAKQPK